MRRIIALLLVSIVLVLIPACATPPSPAALTTATGGRLVSVTPVETLDREAVADRLDALGLDRTRVAHGVRAVRIVYRTSDPAGEPTTASALVVVPDPAPTTARIVSWQHGTTVGRAEVASRSDGPDRATAYALAATGAVVSAPDYLGLGEGPGPHPYLHHASGVTAALDALHAVLALPGLPALDPAVQVGGFSQGGPVSLTLGRALQEGRGGPGLRPGAVASIGGPFDASATVAAALDGGVENGVAYLSYLTMSWGHLHGVFREPAEVFRAPYDTRIPPLFDGEHPAAEIMAALPETLDELFTDSWLDRLRDPDPVLRDALAHEDSTCDWSPAVPVRIYHGGGDRDVPPSNSGYCAAALGPRAAAQVVDLGPVDHGDSLPAALPLVLNEFAG